MKTIEEYKKQHADFANMMRSDGYVRYDNGKGIADTLSELIAQVEAEQIERDRFDEEQEAESEDIADTDDEDNSSGLTVDIDEALAVCAQALGVLIRGGDNRVGEATRILSNFEGALEQYAIDYRHGVTNGS